MVKGFKTKQNTELGAHTQNHSGLQRMSQERGFRDSFNCQFLNMAFFVLPMWNWRFFEEEFSKNYYQMKEVLG